MLLFTVIGCFGYINSIYLYRTTVLYMGIVLIYTTSIIFLFNRAQIKVPSVWMAVWVYIIISTAFLNFPNSVRYLVVFTLGITLMKLSCIAEDFFPKIIKCFSIAGCFFSFGTLLQAFVPSVFHVLLKLVQSNYLYEQTVSYWSKYHACCGFAGESSFNAFCIALGILCLISKAFAERKIGVCRLFIILLSYYAILLTGKRSFLLLIPMIVFFIFLLFAIAESKKKNIIILTVLIVVTPIIFYLFLGDIVLDILASGKGGGNVRAIDLSNREIFWRISFNMLKSKPLFGHGMMSYDNFYNSYFHKAISFAGGHNSFFQLLGEMGIVGAALYFSAIIRTFISGIVDICEMIKQKNVGVELRTVSFYAVFIQIMCITYGFSGNPFHRPQQLLTYFVAVAMGIYVHNRLNELKR